MDYECDWHAPVLAEPNSMTDITSETLSITAGAVQGLGFAPLLGNSVYLRNMSIQHPLIHLLHRYVSLDWILRPLNRKAFF